MSPDIKILKKEIAALASVRANKLHVISTKGSWVVVKDGTTNTFRRFSSKDDATEFAKKYARSHYSEIVIHNKNAEVEKRILQYTTAKN